MRPMFQGSIVALVTPFSSGKVDEAKPSMLKRIDWLHVASLAVFLGALQYVLEEGNRNDWFASGEIKVIALISAISLIFLIIR